MSTATKTTTITTTLVDEFERVKLVKDAHDAAEVVYDRLEASGNLRLLLGPLTNAITFHRRNQVRSIEHAVRTEAEVIVESERILVATAGTKPKKRKTVKGLPAMPSLRGLLAGTFFNGTDHVSYTTATVADYEARIAYLSTKVAGYERTIAFTAKARDAIAAHPGAKTLADVPDSVVVEVMAEKV